MHLTPTLQILDAADNGDAKHVEALIAEDPSLVNASGEYGKTALHWAAENDHGEVAALLLDAGADYGMTTTWGATPLEWAGYMGSRRVAEELLKRGAEGMNLVLAAGLGKLEMVRSYCEECDTLRGLGIPKRPADLADKKGWPPDAARMTGDVLGEAFQVSCRNGHLDTAKYLLGRGAAIDAKGYFGGTGLHWAAVNGHEDVVAFLLQGGADLQLRDHAFDEVAAEWVVEGGHDDLSMSIRNFGGSGLGVEIER